VPEVPDPVQAVDDSPAKNTRGAAERAGAGAADREVRAARARELVQVLTSHARRRLHLLPRALPRRRRTGLCWR